MEMLELCNFNSAPLFHMQSLITLVTLISRLNLPDFKYCILSAILEGLLTVRSLFHAQIIVHSDQDTCQTTVSIILID